MLYAPFVAGVQIILYAGGIMVLFLFVIMLVNVERAMKERQFNSQWVVGIIAATALGGLFIGVYRRGRTSFRIADALHVMENDNTQKIGHACCTDNTCSPSRSPRCCCWWRSSGRW